ncbi:MAG: prolyl oligopeptidase family serine peptidase [Clostridiales bacterium]|nr:prolyl oligopeptidase family serine peptidase [Clostridiales bacterium]
MYKFDLAATGYDWGTPITDVIISFPKPLDREITTQDLPDAFSISIDLKYSLFGFDVDAANDVVTVKSADISGDRTTATLNVGSNFAEHSRTRISNFERYGGSWKVALSKDLGDLKKGTEFTWSGKVINEWADRFERLTVETEYSYVDRRTGETITCSTMDARLYKPDKTKYQDKGNGYPMVVWLHGGGEIGDDNEIHITANAVVNWAKEEAQDIFGGAYILAPQNHAGRSVKACMDVIEYVIAHNPDIDSNRIYVGGCSYGGFATWAIIKAYPDFFAAAFPICGGGGNLSDEDLDNLYDLPIYMVVSTGDSMPVSMMEAYNALVDRALSKGAKPKTYIALFEHVDFDGFADSQKKMAALKGVEYKEEERFRIFAMDHWSWIYVHNNFDGKGDDYDGRMFIRTDAPAELDNCSVVEVTEKNIDEIRATMGEHIAKTVNVGDRLVHLAKDTLDEAGNVVSTTHVYTPNFAPSDIGYETFMQFLAAQRKK